MFILIPRCVYIVYKTVQSVERFQSERPMEDSLERV